MRHDVDFEALVSDHSAALYRFALSMCRHPEDASDLVQETFLRWAERGHQLADASKVRAWLFTTLFREANSRRRRIVRFPHTELSEADAELPELPPVAPTEADAPAVLEALRAVDDPFRDAVALFYLEDYTYPEIAEILDVPVGTVKSRVARGIAQLQRLLNPIHHPRG